MSDGIVVSGGRRLSRAALEERALRAATGLQTLGVGPGDRVAILLRNDFPFFEASRAASALGASPVAVNWHLAPPEIAYVLCDSGAKAVIAHQDLVARLHGALPTGVPLFTVSAPPEICAAYGIDPGPADAWPDERDWSDWLESHAPLAEIRRGFIETMTYTSGTTGRPKGVVRFAQTLEASKAFLATRDRLYGIAPGIRALIAGPMYHAAPNAFAMRALTAADRIVSMPRFEAKEFLALVERHRITNAFLVPTMLVRLLRLPRDVRRTVIGELRRVLKPGGRLVFVDSLQYGDRPGWDGLLEAFPQRFHEPYYGDYLEDDLEAAFCAASLAAVATWPAFLSKVMVRTAV